MNYDWITIAIENKGVVTLSANAKGVAAKMHWKHRDEPVYGDYKSTVPQAITSLNEKLQEDAANEMEC
jgi:hypothetical protein